MDIGRNKDSWNRDRDGTMRRSRDRNRDRDWDMVNHGRGEEKKGQGWA